VPLALPVAALGAWFLAVGPGMIPEYLLPSPQSVGRCLADYVFGGRPDPYSGRFVSDLLASLSRVLGGFGLAVVLGLPFGLASGRLPLLARILSPTVNGLRSVPGICWLPLALVWFGVGYRTTVFLVALAAFFPLYLSAAAGAASVPTVQLRAGAMLGLGRPALVRHVVLPASAGHIRSGLRIGLGLSFAYLVLGELTGATQGLGAMIMDARLLGRVDLVIVGIVLIALTGWVADLLMVFLLRALFASMRFAP
jgi:sulfonate transport system permease protein